MGNYDYVDEIEALCKMYWRETDVGFETTIAISASSVLSIR